MATEETYRVSWTTSGPGVLDRLRARSRALGGRLEGSEGDGFRVALGSRIGYRLWGAFLALGRRRFPLRLYVTAAPTGPSEWQVDAEFTSDQGWYAYQLPQHRRAFIRRCDEIVAALKDIPG